MGKLLQIRVSAWTYDEDAVLRAWPKLAQLAWPRPLYPGEKRGVLELAGALANGLNFEDWGKTLPDTLQQKIHSAGALKEALEQALSNWEPRDANRLSDQLEDTLSALEALVPRR